ncbi:MAG: chorismate mutase [Rhodobacteraceae bacterium]|nr:chorismate mutase [Paracoccaceae bacterium]
MRPADCATMAELRAEIDRIDATIVALLAERSRYIDRASEIKPGLGLPARIEDRVEDVVAKVSARAMAEGLDPELVEDLWRRLINWSIRREENVMGPDG